MTDAARRIATELTAKHGRPPTIAMILTGIEGDFPETTQQTIRQALNRAEIPYVRVRQGNGGNGANHATPPPEKSSQETDARRRTHRKTCSVSAPEPSGGVGASLAIMALQTERTRIAAELLALDSLLERMRR
jgi:hypothetical protein